MKAKQVLHKKVSDFKSAAKPAVQGATEVGKFFVIEGNKGTFQVTGMDDKTPPGPVDISALATLAVESDNPAVVVSSVTDMNCVLTVTPQSGTGTADVTFTATAIDGSWTYDFLAEITYDGGKITAINVTQI